MKRIGYILGRRVRGTLELGLDPGTNEAAIIVAPGERLSGRPEQGIMELATTQNYRFGTKLERLDCVYRYMQADSERQLRASYGVFPQITYAETGVPTVEADAGQKDITLTAVGAPAENEFADGILSKVGAGGGGYGVNYQIKSNTAVVGGEFTVTLYDNIIVAIPVGDTVTLFHSPYRRVVSIAQRLADGVVTDLHKTAVIAVPNRFVPLDNFFWGKVKGPCMVVPAGGAEGVADNERMMAFQEDGAVTRARYEVGGVLDMQIAGFVLPVTTAGAIPDLLEIMLQIE